VKIKALLRLIASAGLNVCVLNACVAAATAAPQDEVSILAEQSQLQELWTSLLMLHPCAQILRGKFKHQDIFVLQRLRPFTYLGDDRLSYLWVPGEEMDWQVLEFLSKNSEKVQTEPPPKHVGRNACNRRCDEEAMMMVQLIRNSACRLFTTYHKYKSAYLESDRNFRDLHRLELGGVPGEQIVKQMKISYNLSKEQTSDDADSHDIFRYRQMMIDLVCPDAVQRLDQELESAQSPASML
jgi:hypothetical protein